MAIINVDDAYILNETGAQVDKTTGIPFKNESLTEAEAAQARANIRAGGSNDNLLDNAYFVGGGSQLGDGKFPINQRGQTQYTAAGFVFDRWFKSGGVTATLDAGGLTIANSNGWPDGVNQRFPMHFFAQMNGEAITASVLYADGSVDSGTAVIDATQNYQWLKYPDAGEIGFQLKNFQDGATYDYFDYISFGAGANSTPKKIKAVKLELGSVSTLANDSPPDYYDELDHCKWYFERIKALSGNYAPMGFGFAASATAATIFVPMHAKRGSGYTVSTSGSFRLVNGQTTYSVTAISKYASVPNNWLILTVTSSGMTAGQPLEFGARGDNAAYIDVNNDL